MRQKYMRQKYMRQLLRCHLSQISKKMRRASTAVEIRPLP